MGAGKQWIHPNRPFEIGPRQLGVSGRETIEMSEANVIVRPSVQPGWVTQSRDPRLVESYVGLKG